MFRVVLSVELSERQDGDNRTDHEAHGEPGEERHSLELVGDGGHEVSDNGAVERVHEHTAQDGDDDEEPLEAVDLAAGGRRRGRGCGALDVCVGARDGEGVDRGFIGGV